MVLERSNSGAMYKIYADPFSTLSIAFARSMGSCIPFIVTASVILNFSRLSTWSFMSDCSGEITTVRPLVLMPLISAGSWNVTDLPPPVGKTARKDF